MLNGVLSFADHIASRNVAGPKFLTSHGLDAQLHALLVKHCPCTTAVSRSLIGALETATVQ